MKYGGFNSEEELIEYMKGHYDAYNIFKELSEEEKEKYFMYMQSTYYLDSYLRDKGDEFILSFIDNYDMNEFSDSFLYEVIYCLTDKNLIVSHSKALTKSFFKYYKCRYFLKELESDFNRIVLINRAVSLGIDKTDLKDIVFALENDKNKIKYFPMLSIASQAELIKRFNDIELQKEYVMKKEYSNYRSDLVVCVRDHDFVCEIFDRINVKKFRYNLIKKTDDLILKEKLIRKLNNPSLTAFIDSFNMSSKSSLLKYDVDPSITIGVELETCHKDIEAMQVLNEMPNGFRIKRDASVKSGFEIVSPVLNFNEEDMSSLETICDILEKNRFYTDQSCGGHIHLGASYLENIDEYKMFLHLYCNCENIIYLICNRENSKERSSVPRYAARVKKQYKKACENGVFEEEYESLDSFREKLINLNDSRYKGLNLYNLKTYGINTFEFRMANGEINFGELCHNIRLYGRLLQVSKELANMPSDDVRWTYLELLSMPMKESEKLELLLKLLFEEEEDRIFYRNRYKKNGGIIHSVFGNIKKESDYVPIVKPMSLTLRNY